MYCTVRPTQISASLVHVTQSSPHNVVYAFTYTELYVKVTFNEIKLVNAGDVRISAYSIKLIY